MSSVTKQVKKYRNRLKIRDFESLPYQAASRNPFSFGFDNSSIVWVFVSPRQETTFSAVETTGLLSV